MHINIHYLYSKLDELKILLSNQTNIDVLCICETFLNDTFSDSEIQLENYVISKRQKSKWRVPSDLCKRELTMFLER